MKNTNISGAVLLCLSISACNHQNEAAHEAELHFNGDTVSVSPTSPIMGKISIDTTTLTLYKTSFTTVGTVRAEAGKLAEAGVPFDGRTIKAHVRLGQQVRAGQPLFSFSSAEASDLAKSYFQAVSGEELARKELARKTALKEKGIASERELEEARSAAEIAYRELNQSENAIKMLGIDPADLGTGNSLNINAPISGEVVTCEVVPGQYVKSDSDPLIVIADLSEVWVVAQVKEPYIGSVHESDQAEVVLESGAVIPGKITYVGKMLDDQTRSAEVIIACANADRRLLPGMFTRVKFSGIPSDVVMIPSSSVLQGEQGSYVFVKMSDGRFSRRKVTVISAEQGKVVVTEGLVPGEAVVSAGGIYIAG